MSNEIGINWKKGGVSQTQPLFEIPNDSEMDELFSESMALFGEACYVQEAYDEYILEAKDGGPGILTSTARLIKNLIGRFVRAITRFMSNQTCKKAIKFFNDSNTRTKIKANIKMAWPLKKGEDPAYALMVAAFRMKLLLKHVEVYEFIMRTDCDDAELINAKLGDMDLGVADTGHFKITGVTPEGCNRIIDKMFGSEGLDGGNKTLKDVIKTLEKFNSFWSPFDEEGKNSVVVKMVTTDIKAFAQFQKELLESYKFFKSLTDKDLEMMNGVNKNSDKVNEVINDTKSDKKETTKESNKDIPINYKKKMMENHLDNVNKGVQDVLAKNRAQDEERYAAMKKEQEEAKRKEDEEEARLRREYGID